MVTRNKIKKLKLRQKFMLNFMISDHFIHRLNDKVTHPILFKDSFPFNLVFPHVIYYSHLETQQPIVYLLDHIPKNAQKMFIFTPKFFKCKNAKKPLSQEAKIPARDLHPMFQLCDLFLHYSCILGIIANGQTCK